jgi:hypothetical protein
MATTKGMVAGLVILPDESDARAMVGIAFIPEDPKRLIFGVMKDAAGFKPAKPADPSNNGLVDVENVPKSKGEIIGGMLFMNGSVGKVIIVGPKPGGKIDPMPGGSSEFIDGNADAPVFMLKFRAACSSIMNCWVGDMEPVVKKNGFVPGKNMKFLPLFCMLTAPAVCGVGSLNLGIRLLRVVLTVGDTKGGRGLVNRALLVEDIRTRGTTIGVVRTEGARIKAALGTPMRIMGGLADAGPAKKINDPAPKRTLRDL